MKPKPYYDPTTTPTIVFDDPAQFRAALTGRGRRASHRAAEARPELPRGGRARASGIGPLITAGWRPEYDARYGHRLTHSDGRTTCWHASEAEACGEAKLR